MLAAACGGGADVAVLDAPTLDVRPAALDAYAPVAAAESESQGFRLGDVAEATDFEFKLVLPPTNEELALSWWEWAATEPDATNPVMDTTGEDCARNQSGNVWFLAGSFGTYESRTCTIPAGQEIFVPLLNWICAPGDGCEGSFSNDNRSADLREVDVPGAAPSQPIYPEPVYVSAEGAIATSAGNSITGEGGTYDVAVGGWWVRVGPLEPGQYEFGIFGSEVAGSFTVEVDYILTVE